VHDAVLYCLKHRHVQIQRNSATNNGTDPQKIGFATTPEEIQVDTSNEIGISNDLHNTFTVVNITLAKETAPIIHDIVAVFPRNGQQIVRAEMEPLGAEESAGQKHAYFLKNKSTGLKLTEPQIASLKDDLDGIVAKALRGDFSMRSASFLGYSSSFIIHRALSGRLGPEEEVKERAPEGNSKLMHSLACTWCSK